MTRQYTKPPVVEAVCEFKFANSQPWDMLLPGRIAERIRDVFPVNEPFNTVQVTPDLNGPQSVQLQTGIRFLTDDRTESVQIAVNTLSVHQLGKYRDWEHFKSRI